MWMRVYGSLHIIHREIFGLHSTLVCVLVCVCVWSILLDNDSFEARYTIVQSKRIPYNA